MLLVDLKQDKSYENKYFSNTLLNGIDTSLANKQKVILYLNKRGDYASLICEGCSSLFKCENCDISMSVHDDFLLCHICGFSKKVPVSCEFCGKKELYRVGIGTAQIEKFLKEKYKGKRIYRFDTDSVKKKKEKIEALDEILKADIIIGTKMITTGFDIENIGLIGIILLEQELQIPKYDTSEKLYSNLKQILGRGGRKGEKTNFIIQSYIAENKLIKDLVFSNYKDFFTNTLKERKSFNYPPFCEFIILDYRDKTKEKSQLFMTKLKEKLENKIGERKIELIKYPHSFKKNNSFHTRIILKGINIKAFLCIIKKEIFSIQGLSIVFD